MKRHLIFLCAIFAAGLMRVAAVGLDAPQAIGPFLNGAFPATTPGQSGTWALEHAFPNLTFVDPVDMVTDPRDSGYVYVVCRNGEIWRVPFRANAANGEKVRALDRRANTFGWWDAGMISMTFHPKFGEPGNPNRGYVYVFYQYLPQQPSPRQVNSPSYMRLSRFTIPDGSAVIDPASEYVMIQQFDRHNWHNGGPSFFGPDGFFYLVIGDEGDANDSYNVCQKINDRLFSGILRIDVDCDPARSHPIRRQPRQISMPSGWQQSFTQGYYIPNDNPWQDPAGGVLEEFWSIGTRSPHSMHFDPATGKIWIAEVGQGAREEITIARRGGNHQWPYREGLANGPKAKPASLIGEDVPPVYDYPRGMGGCIIGGIVYRGALHANSLAGKYLFGDHNTKAVYALTERPGQTPQIEYLTSVFRSGGTKRGLSRICEGPDGEAYFMELGDTGQDTGRIYRLVRQGAPVADPPRWLSQTGAFSDLVSLTPAAGLIPFGVNSPLWTDGSVKRRWVAIPNDGNHNSAAERVIFRPEGAWDFPPGTVLVKHFALPVDENNPTAVRAIETRFLVNGTDGKYYGVTYRWNEAGTDAELLISGEQVEIDIALADGGTRRQVWDIPARSDCRTCHGSDAGSALGPRAHQLNGDFLYPSTGRTANQLETWAALGIFGNSFNGHSPASLPKSVAVDDPHASLDHRARSYLDANCSHCHKPGGVDANFDARFTTPLSAQGFVNGLINRPLGDPDVVVVDPGNLARSLLHSRVSATGPSKMPPLGRNLADEKAVDLLADWIRSMNSASFVFGGGANQAPLAGDDIFETPHGRESRLDVMTNDSDANAPPGIHGLAIVEPPAHGTLRILGAEKRLEYVHDGTAAWSDSFAYTLTDPQGAVSAVAWVELSIPQDFAAWSAVMPGAGGSAASNADGDLFDDLLEFALGGAPDNGADADALQLSLEGGVALKVRRPSGLSGLTYLAETSGDLAGWEEMEATGIEPHGEGFELLTFNSLGDRAGLSADGGFVRLRVRSGTSDESVTLPLGWKAGTFGPGTRSLGIPFRESPLFGSSVKAVDGRFLEVHGTPGFPAGFAGFAEVLDGSYAGHRFEVDAEASAAGRLALAAGTPRDTLPEIPDLTGARIAVSAYHRLGGVFPKELFQGSANPTHADQVQFFSHGAFQLYYLLDARPGNPVHQWRAFLPGGGDQGGRAIAPGEGMIVKRPAGVPPLRLVVAGQVRANAFVQPLSVGRNFAGQPFPLPMTPRQRGLLDGGFYASTNLSAADQFHLLENGVFRIFYLLDHPSQPDPWREAIAGSPDHGDSPLFRPDAAAFFRVKDPHPFLSISPPWSP